MQITTGRLIDHAETIEPLARLMQQQWPDWYRDPAKARGDLVSRLNDARLPLGLVAFANGRAAGACALTLSSGGLVTDRTPWVGGLLVDPGLRRKGLAAALLARATEEAQLLGHERLYALTATAHELFGSQGWQRIENIELDGQAHAIYCAELIGEISVKPLR
ncbi:N-acetylglutamate synthase-like GNAT family acetyltransferase [Devosia subaequoris]|uniref:N-acetylglutamate synthase-like GNAT family acetyltransferase n=1 Tax=Devosia subaequoris TaxID=395930 RepID=A0A7W6IQ63_9HYPH|nr:GNAT family N-acetyltransferase [Devosia subaequoris]MBB4053151.1 N-acetylglutamate synthase-like GNAT family acetyltransferase [Devosia subaequoris]MCP1210717.1 GNAT family N-acetyltransferase [Devosia subaequoris]